MDYGGGEHWLLDLNERSILGDAIAALSSAGVSVLTCHRERSEVEDAFASLSRGGRPMSAQAATLWGVGSLRGEAAKLRAFLRRDLLVAWSYRMAFFSDFANLGAQVLLFFYIGKLVPSESLPTYGGVQASYIEFVTLGIVVNVFVQVALTRISTALRQEQMIGTLEAVLLTPTAAATVQIGSAVFDLVYVPLRTASSSAFMVLFAGVDLEPSGILPALVILLTFIPFVWGLGIAAAAAIVTFKRGAGTP